MSAGAGDVGGGLCLAVQCIGGDHRSSDVHRVDQLAQLGDLVGLGADGTLPDHRAAAVMQGGQKVWGVPVAAGTA